MTNIPGKSTVHGLQVSSPIERLISKAELRGLTGYSDRSIYNKIADGSLPAPLKLAPGKQGRIAWRESDVANWLSSLPRRAAQHEKAPAGPGKGLCKSHVSSPEQKDKIASTIVDFCVIGQSPRSRPKENNGRINKLSIRPHRGPASGNRCRPWSPRASRGHRRHHPHSRRPASLHDSEGGPMTTFADTAQAAKAIGHNKRSEAKDFIRRELLAHGRDLTRTDLAIAIVYLDGLNWKDGFCYHGAKALSDATGCSRRSVMSARKKLSDLGLIVFQRVLTRDRAHEKLKVTFPHLVQFLALGSAGDCTGVVQGIAPKPLNLTLEEKPSPGATPADRASKGSATELKKRAKAGTCPCCNRTFSNMAAHMRSQHPEFDPTVVDIEAERIKRG